MSSPSSHGPRGNSKPEPSGTGPRPPAAIRASPPAAPPRVPSPIRVAQRKESAIPSPVQGVFTKGQVSLRAAVPVVARTMGPPAPKPPGAQRTAQPLTRGGVPASNSVQRKSDGSVDAFLVNLPASHGGQALPDTVRAKMESALGADFSDVRVHVGPQASSIGALAFTRGSDIYFAPGQYNPSSLQGQQILGHELTHVVQQRQGRVSNPFGSGVAVVQDRQLEAEADRLGWRAAMTPTPRGDGK
jgi:Domain of unknown function (DUF4157)